MPRQPKIRLSEPEARILALRIAATFPQHQASTSEIKDLVPSYVFFTPWPPIARLVRRRGLAGLG